MAEVWWMAAKPCMESWAVLVGAVGSWDMVEMGRVSCN